MGMPTTSELPPEDWALWRSMRAMNQHLSRALDRQLQRDAGISQADYGILVTLFESPEHQRRTGELGELLGWEKSRVSHQVARMESRGLVTRVECESDGRGTWVTLTPDGSRAFLGAVRQHAEAIRQLFLDQVEPDDKEALRRISTRVLDKLNPEACDILEASPMATA